MPSNNSVFSFTAPKPRHDDVTQKTASQASSCSTGQAIVLDMGEASRLEGFRLNGCR
jgi:hypothetical protein